MVIFRALWISFSAAKHRHTFRETPLPQRALAASPPPAARLTTALSVSLSTAYTRGLLIVLRIDVFNQNSIIAAEGAFSNVTAKTYLGRPWGGVLSNSIVAPTET